VLRAVIQAGSDVAGIPRPTRVAIAFTRNALSVATAALPVSRATRIAMSSTPAVLARALPVEADAVARAAIAGLVLLAVTVAVLLRAIVSSVLLVANAGHLLADRHANTIA